jgi:hypothetical protein
MTMTTTEKPQPAMLYDYLTGDVIRPATLTELRASVQSAEQAPHTGVIEINGQAVYVA